MNTKVVLAMIPLVAILTGCTRDAAVPATDGSGAFGAPADPAHNSRNALDWAGTYHGVLPCADCEGIETMVTLRQDGSYVMRSRYRGKDETVFVEQGNITWSDDGGSVTLPGSEPVQYRVGENQLARLALDGSVITGDLATNYLLAKIPEGIRGQRWELVELRGQPVTAPGRRPYLEFGIEESRVSGFAGCNQLTGGYLLDETTLRLSFDQVATTLMACAEGMDTEQAFTEVLGMVDNYSMGEGQLSLNRARMAPLARLEVTLPR